jgi:hypothetical protein
MASSWTGPQIATLSVNALTPITLAGFGALFARTSRRIARRTG